MTNPAGQMRRAAGDARFRTFVDLAGLAIFGALLGWVAWAGVATGANADPLLGGLLAAGGMFVLARMVSRHHGWAVPAGVAIAAVALALRHWDVLLGGPLASPLGYSNATGAFYVQAAAAAVMVALRAPRRAVRRGAVALAVAFAFVPWGNGADTAAALVLGLPLAAAVAAGPLRARTVVAGGALLVVAAALMTTAVGAAYDHDAVGARPVDRLVDATLSERRAQLWHDAIVLLRTEPATGVGPGRYVDISPTARSDDDMVAAHHELLQLGAETGVVGLILGLGLAGYGFARLWAGPRDAGTAAAAIALAAVGVHANVDYVLQFPAVALAAAAVAGAGTAPGERTWNATPP